MTIRIPYYVTDSGLLVRLETGSPQKVLVNGKPLKNTFHPQWWVVKGEAELQTYSVHAGTRAVNEWFVLINPSVVGVESVIRRDDVERDKDGRWTGKHAG